MAKKVITLIINLAIVVMVGYAWSVMLFWRGAEALTAMGIWSLKYFTVLSNLLVGLASLIYAFCLFRQIRSGAKIPGWAHRLKFAATVAVTVTLMTALLFLGPMLGYAAMFSGPNLWLHLVIPVTAIVEFVFLDTSRKLSFGDTFLGVVPTLLYGIAYVGNILLNGVGSGAATNDWYGFTQWGLGNLPIVFGAMLAATWVFAIVIWLGNMLMRKVSLRSKQDGQPR